MPPYRIQWLDMRLDEALLIKGRWWWKRCATVHRVEVPNIFPVVHVWQFEYSEFRCADEIQMALEQERSRLLSYGHDELDWHPYRKRRISASGSSRQSQLRLLP